MMNLLEETMYKLKQYNKTSSDVLWIGTNKKYTTWEQFAQIANLQYNDGYGGPEIYMDLKIVGSDWWLERYEYDGAERWVFKTYPTKPDIFGLSARDILTRYEYEDD